ncbi:hypothetical protein HanRHA438_Chr01g0008501 [Helianthus annuus]|nr:hypothetical protein HanRHA438_Chr01g0008501 [Helianthus annuus]
MVVQFTRCPLLARRSLRKLHARVCSFGFHSVVKELSTSKGPLGSDRLVNNPR